MLISKLLKIFRMHLKDLKHERLLFSICYQAALLHDLGILPVKITQL